MNNPFELLEKKLSNIESLLLDLKHGELKPGEPQPPEIPEILSRKEVAELLGITLVTLDNWVKRSLIPASRIGSRVLFKREDVYKALKDVETLKYRRG